MSLCVQKFVDSVLFLLQSFIHLSSVAIYSINVYVFRIPEVNKLISYFSSIAPTENFKHAHYTRNVSTYHFLKYICHHFLWVCISNSSTTTLSFQSMIALLSLTGINPFDNTLLERYSSCTWKDNRWHQNCNDYFLAKFSSKYISLWVLDSANFLF